MYNASNSGFPLISVMAIAVATDGSLWFGAHNGSAHFDGTNWTVYPGQPFNDVRAISVHPDGSVWFISMYGTSTARFDGTNWTALPILPPIGGIKSLAIDGIGSLWFGTNSNGVAALRKYPSYPVDENAQWLDTVYYTRYL